MIKDSEYEELAELYAQIKDVIIEVFLALGSNNIESIKQFETEGLINEQQEMLNFYKNKNKQLVIKDVVILNYKWDILDRDDAGMNAVIFMPKLSIETYIVDNNTQEVVEGIKEYQEEIEYKIVLVRNDELVKDNKCSYCGAELESDTSICNYCGLENKRAKWLITFIDENGRRNFLKEYNDANIKENRRLWREFGKEVRRR